MYIFKEKYTVRYCKTLIFNWSLTRLGKMSCKSFNKKNVSDHSAVGVSDFSANCSCYAYFPNP